jgi:uncharacterized OB-fold protein
MVWAESIPRAWRERVKKYRLLGGKCPSCGSVVYPYRQVCPYCGSEVLQPVELPRRGRVISYTVVRHPPSDFVGKEPYVVAIVELEGRGWRSRRCSGGTGSSRPTALSSTASSSGPSRILRLGIR